MAALPEIGTWEKTGSKGSKRGRRSFFVCLFFLKT